MPDSPEVFLSVEQREEMRTVGLRTSGNRLLDHCLEADRIIAELREEGRKLHAYIAKLNDALAAKNAEIAAAAETLRLSQLQYKLVTERAAKSSQENERLGAALEAADLEHMNAVCDGAYYKPDESRMKIFRDGLREALAATPPAKEGK